MPTPVSELNEQRMARMTERLTAKLDIGELSIIDDSARHAGHAGARDGRGHFKMTLTATEFEGLSTLKRHRLVYDILGDMMHTDIHALSINAQTNT